MSSPNFRKPIGAPVSPPAAASLPPGFVPPAGGLPLQRNKVFVTDDTTRQLQVIGIDDPNLIPPNLADKVAEVTKKFHGEEVAARKEVAAVGATTRIKQGPTRDISELDPQAIAELTVFAKQYADRMKNPQAALPLPPQIAAAVNQVESASQETEVVIEEPVAAAAPAGSPASMPQPAAAEPTSDAGAESVPDLCPRCFHDRRVEFKAEPTNIDIRNFVVAILSGKRFYWQTPLFGGQLLVTFRSLTSIETETIFTQLRYDMLDQKLVGEADYFARMADYRLALGIHKVVDAKGGVLTQVDDEIQFDPDPEKPHETLAAKMHQWFITDIAKHDIARRVYGQQHRQFQRLHETLEVRAADPNFWNGIG